ncbi:hypothetical protein ACWD1Z_37590, partial [Streptomyces sp. NPDC002784]
MRVAIGSNGGVFSPFSASSAQMEVQREQVLRTRRGHERLVTPGTGAKAKLTSADRVLVTVLHLRKLATLD